MTRELSPDGATMIGSLSPVALVPVRSALGVYAAVCLEEDRKLSSVIPSDP